MYADNLVNLTPHPIIIYPAGTPDLITAGTLEPLRVIPRADGPPARLAVSASAPDAAQESPASPRWVPIVDCQYTVDKILGLPDPADGVGYIVSLPVALAAAGDRDDLFVPFHEVRNRAGTVVGCRALGRPHTDPSPSIA